MEAKEDPSKVDSTCEATDPLDQDSNYNFLLDEISFSDVVYAEIESGKFIRGSTFIGELGESVVARQLARAISANSAANKDADKPSE